MVNYKYVKAKLYTMEDTVEIICRNFKYIPMKNIFLQFLNFKTVQVPRLQKSNVMMNMTYFTTKNETYR